MFGNETWGYEAVGSQFKEDARSKVICDGLDKSVQATVEMWDDNVITFVIATGIVDDVAAGDIVLVDYTPTQSGKDGIPVPRNTIVKVMKGVVGEKAWTAYRNFHQKRMQVVTQAQPQMYR